VPPVVTVIIPVGPRHIAHLPVALASVKASTAARFATVIICNDSGAELPDYGYPVLDTGGGKGASAARNLGIRAAAAPWLTFLDADDYLTPRGLEWLLRGAAHYPQAGYIYGDHWNIHAGGGAVYGTTIGYDLAMLAQRNLHTVTALIPTAAAQAVGGFPGDIRIWEDWAFYLALAQAGVCGQKVPAATIVYRLAEGSNRADGERDPALAERVRTRYIENGRIKNRMGCCGQSGPTHGAAKQAADSLGVLGTGDDGGLVRMEYQGDNDGAVSFRVASGNTYRGGRVQSRYANVDPADVAELEQRGWARVLRLPTEEAPPPPPAPVEPFEPLPEIVFTPSAKLEEAIEADEAAAVLEDASAMVAAPKDKEKTPRGRR
jgi:hypothetical protein